MIIKLSPALVAVVGHVNGTELEGLLTKGFCNRDIVVLRARVEPITEDQVHSDLMTEHGRANEKLAAGGTLDDADLGKLSIGDEEQFGEMLEEFSKIEFDEAGGTFRLVKTPPAEVNLFIGNRLLSRSLAIEIYTDRYALSVDDGVEGTLTLAHLAEIVGPDNADLKNLEAIVEEVRKARAAWFEKLRPAIQDAIRRGIVPKNYPA